MSADKQAKADNHRTRGRGRKVFWSVVWAAVIFGTIYATWTPRTERGDGSRAEAALLEGDLARVFDAIDASDAQRAALTPTLDRARSLLADADRERRELEAELRVQLRADEPDPTAIAALRQRAIALSAAAVDSAFELTLEIWAELNAEQRAEILSHWNRRG